MTSRVNCGIPLRVRVFLGIALLGFLLSSCLITFDPDSVELSDCSVGGHPSLEVQSPTPGEDVQCTEDDCKLYVELNYCNFDLVDQFGEQADGEGYYTLAIDGSLIDHLSETRLTLRAPAVPVNTNGNGQLRLPGPHELRIDTFYGDGTPHDRITPVLRTWNLVRPDDPADAPNDPIEDHGGGDGE